MRRASNRHECPGCSRVVRWKLLYCASCSWDGAPLKNREWKEGDRKKPKRRAA